MLETLPSSSEIVTVASCDSRITSLSGLLNLTVRVSSFSSTRSLITAMLTHKGRVLVAGWKEMVWLIGP